MLKAAALIVLVAVVCQVDFLRFTRSYKVHTHGVVLISGASSGIGRDAAIHMGTHGFHVLAGVRKEQAYRDLESYTNVHPVILDVTNDTQIQLAVQQAVQMSKSHNIPFVAVINNAGYSSDSPVEYLTRARIHAVYDTNLFGAMILSSAALPELIKSNGRIINIGSLGGRTSAPLMQPYVGTKMAMDSFSDSLRREVGEVVAVAQINPGCIRSKMVGKILDKDAVANMEAIPEERQELYGPKIRHYKDHLSRCGRWADPTETSTTPAIMHALTSPYPSTRYIPGSWNRIPSEFIAFQSWALPDLVNDYLLAQPLPAWLP